MLLSFVLSILRPFKLLRLVVIVVPFHLICHVIFGVWNSSGYSFNEIWKDISEIAGYCLQIDVASIILINLPVFVLLMISMYISGRIKKNIIVIAFIIAAIINIIGLALNIFDAGYFKFSHQRITISLFSVFIDSIGSFKSIMNNYWPLFIISLIVFIVLLFVLRLFFRSIQYVDRVLPAPLSFSHVTILMLFFFLVRGTKQSPMTPSSPLLSISPINLPLVQNSVHTLLYSMVRKQRQLVKKNYFTTQELDTVIRLDKIFTKEGAMLKNNVIIFILESFSRDFFEAGNLRRAKTPFFDSLIKISTYYPNSFSNSFSSNQGIVSILAGIPPFIDEPFYYSVYANTKMEGIGKIFKRNGFNTNFFMGAGEDHFGFGRFCNMIGIDHYYGRREFNDDSEYDGNWGIYDEPFLQFGLSELNKKTDPFFSVFFTISSHPPFTIPIQYQRKFNYPEQSAAQKSISYVDFSFRKFFDGAKKSKWFNNTLFVFCADHWIAPDDTTPWSYVKSSAIPIFIFDPLKPHGRADSTIAGQVDIMPTVLDKLNYSGDYTGFGRSLLDSVNSTGYVVNRMNYIHQVINKEFVLGYNEPAEKSQYLYNYKKDPGMKFNLVGDEKYLQQKQSLERIIRANIQQYNNSLLKRNLYSQ